MFEQRPARHESPPDTLPRLLGLAKEVLQGKVVDFFRHKAVVQARIKDAPLPRGEKLEPGQCSGRDQLNYVEELRPPRSITPEMTLRGEVPTDPVWPGDVAKTVPQ